MFLPIFGLNREAKFTSYIKSLSGLVAYWPMNETSGNMINNAPANLGSLDGTVVGATQNVSGRLGKAYSFDGVNDNANVADNALLNFGAATDFTLLCLFNTSMATTDMWLMGKGSGAATYRLRIFNSSVLGATIGDGSAISTTGATVTVTDGDWHLGVATFDRDGNCVVYVDGSQDGNALNISGEGNIDAAQAFRIGEAVGGSADYTGLMQHAAVFNRLLTQSEISALTAIAGV